MRAVFGIMVGSCMSCGTLKSTWVKNAIVLDGHLIDLPHIRDRIVCCCWCFTVCLGILVEHVSDQVHDAARAALHGVVPAHNLYEGGAQPDASLGSEGEGDGGGLEVGGRQCLVNDLRTLSMSPSERRFVSAQVSTRWSPFWT